MNKVSTKPEIQIGSVYSVPTKLTRPLKAISNRVTLVEVTSTSVFHSQSQNSSAVRFAQLIVIILCDQKKIESESLIKNAPLITDDY